MAIMAEGLTPAQPDAPLRPSPVEGIEGTEPVYEARTAAEREAIYAFRHRIYVEELGRKLGRDASGREWVHDADDERPLTTHFYTLGAEGEVTGAVRGRFWPAGEVPAKDYAAFSMERFDGIGQLATGELGRLMVAPGARGTQVLVALLSASYDLGAGRLGADLTFLNCMPALVRLYRRLGCRPYNGRLVQTPDGSEVPMVLVMSDLEGLAAAGSFFAPYAQRYYGEGLREPMDFSRFAPVFESAAVPLQDDPDAVVAEVEAHLLAAQCPTLGGFTPETLTKLAAEGMLLRLGADELLTEKGLGQREVFVVMDGLFEAFDGDRFLRLLSPGDVIGEVAYFSTSGRRTASVRAVTDGRVFVLRASAIKRLRRSDPAAAAEVVTHFARVLADRMTPAA